MARIRIGIIGLGNAVEPHAKSLIDLKDRVEVVAAASRSEERIKAFATRFPFPVTRDIEGVLGASDVDAVWILTPPNSHLELVREAARGRKHVLLEKPLDISLDRAEAIVAGMRGAGLTLGVTLQHRFRPASLRLKALLDEGALGRIGAASCTVPWWRPQAYYDQPGRCTLARDGGGVLITQAIHTLDLFRSLVGDMTVTAATAATTPVHRMETEDFAAALVRLDNGAPGVIQATTAAFPGGEERIEIMGTLGTAWLAGGTLRVAFIDGREEIVVRHEGATGGGANVMDFPHDWHRALIGDFLDAIKEGREPVVSGAEALRSQQLIAAILDKAGWRTA
ncbi:Gfo/Idh/MocA family protein [Phreatobacter oligotrophus]|uniref:Gfo/Idh/MocA family protein n=1 Tax=Phreatobacter oligotrophus TaxID=1122261 RepID=UPI00235581EB|nr:Gfo/Idh/MocA family oxidoreductase [Phreatobacter oligotrophus]MBX9991117.1 Gfo/Idh/MocA family oxidoreductase [Phreatobacter oligotrophus]